MQKVKQSKIKQNSKRIPSFVGIGLAPPLQCLKAVDQNKIE